MEITLWSRRIKKLVDLHLHIVGSIELKLKLNPDFTSSEARTTTESPF